MNVTFTPELTSSNPFAFKENRNSKKEKKRNIIQYIISGSQQGYW